MSSPAQLDLGECCKTSTNVHLNSSQLWGIQPHSWVLFAFLGISMKMGVCLHKYLRNERKKSQRYSPDSLETLGFFGWKRDFLAFQRVGEDVPRERSAPIASRSHQIPILVKYLAGTEVHLLPLHGFGVRNPIFGLPSRLLPSLGDQV